MGNLYSSFDQTNVNQTQISQVNQKCGQSGSTTISDITITAIDSHLGDIELSAQLAITKMDCVMNSLIQSTAISTISDKSEAKQQVLPFQATVNSYSSTDIENISSFQQSLTDQACTQSATAAARDVTMTFIDSTTGNIKIVTTLQVDTFNCNLAAASYQAATSQVTNASSAQQTASCCGVDLSMIIPVIIGMIALGVVAKLARGKPASAAGGPPGGMDPMLSQSLSTALLGNAITNMSKPPTASKML